MPNSGWPNASTLRPSTYVTVPVATVLMSPRTSSTPIAEPGSTRPAAGGPGLRPPPACIGTRPVGDSCVGQLGDRARA